MMIQSGEAQAEGHHPRWKRAGASSFWPQSTLWMPFETLGTPQRPVWSSIGLLVAYDSVLICFQESTPEFRMSCFGRSLAYVDMDGTYGELEK